MVLYVLSFLILPLTLLAKTILLTGGTGYIGSHISVVLLQNGYDVVLVDNLANSKATAIKHIEAIAKKGITKFHRCDLTDQDSLGAVFEEHTIDAVIHLAGFKSVAESVENPLAYYKNNLISTIYLLEVMKKFGCSRLLFSSSATIYGLPHYLPLDENHPPCPTNPYGRTKWMIEEILKDVAKADPNSHFICLRYFNPIGGHPSGLIGEQPNKTPQNLMPYLMDVVSGKRPYLFVYGNDYETPDGTAIRDYIHVMDVAEGHVHALNALFTLEPCFNVYNLGTGKGYSVMEMIDAVSRVLKREIPYKIAQRRQGDVPELVADPTKAMNELGFYPKKSLEDMVRDTLYNAE